MNPIKNLLTLTMAVITMITMFCNLTQAQETPGGLLGVYYLNNNFTGRTMERVENINLTGESVPGFTKDFFSVRWTGHLKPFTTEKYHFYLFLDDGGRLWINDHLVIDAWKGNDGVEFSGSIDLEADSLYAIRVEFFDFMHENICQLRWSTSTIAKDFIPDSCLFSHNAAKYALVPVITPYREFFKDSVLVSMTSPTSDAVIHYAINSTPNQNSQIYTSPFYVYETCKVNTIAYKEGYNPSPIMTAALQRYSGVGGDGLKARYTGDNNTVYRTDSTINFNLGGHTFLEYPDPLIGCEDFQVQWTGYLVIPETDTYTFYLRGDDFAAVYFNKLPFLQTLSWDKEISKKRYFEKGRIVPLRVEFIEYGEDAVCYLRWSSSSFSKRTIPTRYFFTDSLLAVQELPNVLTSYNTIGMNQIVKIYPNPASGSITINTTQIGADANLRLFDTRGQLVDERYLEWDAPKILDISHLANGIYYLEILSKGIRHTSKLVVINK